MLPGRHPWPRLLFSRRGASDPMGWGVRILSPFRRVASEAGCPRRTGGGSVPDGAESSDDAGTPGRLRARGAPGSTRRDHPQGRAGGARRPRNRGLSILGSIPFVATHDLDHRGGLLGGGAQPSVVLEVVLSSTLGRASQSWLFGISPGRGRCFGSSARQIDAGVTVSRRFVQMEA